VRSHCVKGEMEMNPFDKLFDYNGDGELDCFERAVQYQFLDESEKKNDSSDDADRFYEDDE